MPTLADNVRNIPPVTRFFTITTIIICLACSIELVGPGDFAFSTNILLEVINTAYYRTRYSPTMVESIKAVIMALTQAYRFLTCFLVPQGILSGHKFEAIMDIYFFYTFANNVERGKFNNNFADCLFFTCLTGTIIIILTTLYGLIDPLHFPFHHQMMLSCITYIWSRSSKNSIINFLGIVPIKAYYLPLFNLVIKLIINGFPSFFDTFVGIVGGYLYQCIQSDTIPIYNLITTSYNQGNGMRVGTSAMNFNTLDDIITDSIFDKGYLKAPIWFYNLIDYPTNNSRRTTAFTGPVRKNSTSVVSTGTSSSVMFQGKGRRLGGP